jgi:branched-chain amino acid transport system permease protein
MSVLPFFAREYYVEILIIFLINVILAVSYRLIATTGDWTLCHVVLMGAGAYASALMAKHFGWPFWMTAPLAGATAGLVGFGIVYPQLRTVGFGFFIASLAIGEFIRLVWIKFHTPFGGPRGMIKIPYLGELGSIDFYEAIPYYFMTLVFTLVCVFIMYRIDRSRIGNVFKVIYEDDILAESIGIKVRRYRSFAFVFGSFFAGIAGALLAHRLSDDSLRMDASAAGMAALILWRYLDRIFDIYAGRAREFDCEVYTPVWKTKDCAGEG